MFNFSDNHNHQSICHLIGHTGSWTTGASLSLTHCRSSPRTIHDMEGARTPNTSSFRRSISTQTLNHASHSDSSPLTSPHTSKTPTVSVQTTPRSRPTDYSPAPHPTSETAALQKEEISPRNWLERERCLQMYSPRNPGTQYLGSSVLG